MATGTELLIDGNAASVIDMSIIGAQVIFLIAAPPARGPWANGGGTPAVPASVNRWERLARDMAEEHGVHVALANLVGSEGGKMFPGASMVMGPKGDLRVRGNLALALQLDTVFGNGKRPARWPRSGTVRAAGLQTSYLEAGRGTAVVLLHGLGATNASLLPTLWDLARDHRVVAPDLPGFGESAKPVRSYNAQFYARWLAALLDQLGIDRVHLVGNSMGGRVALEAGLEHPDRVDRMVLLAPSPAFIRYREFVRVVRVLRPELAVIPVRPTHRQVVRGIKGMFSRPERLPDEWYDAAADEFLRVFRTARGRVAFFSAARQIYLEEPHGETGFWDRLPAMTRPALFVWGERDRLVPAKFARHVERALPNSDAVVFEDCGHVPQYELPKRTNVLIREFLGQAS